MSLPAPPSDLQQAYGTVYNIVVLLWSPSNDTNDYILSISTTESTFILKFMITGYTESDNIFIPYLEELSNYGDEFIVSVCAVNSNGNSSSINTKIKFITDIPNDISLPAPSTNFTSINNTANFYWSGFYNYIYFMLIQDGSDPTTYIYNQPTTSIITTAQYCNNGNTYNFSIYTITQWVSEEKQPYTVLNTTSSEIISLTYNTLNNSTLTLQSNSETVNSVTLQWDAINNMSYTIYYYSNYNDDNADSPIPISLNTINLPESTSTYTFSNLPNELPYGSSYYFIVLYYDTNSYSTCINQTYSYPLVMSPITSCIGGNEYVTVNWPSSSPNVTEYYLSYSTSIDGTFQPANNGNPIMNNSTLTSYSYTIVGLVNGTTYYFMLQGSVENIIFYAGTVEGTPVANNTPDVETLPCFLADSKVLTDKGLVPIQLLKKGDLIQTLNDGLLPVKFVGVRSFFNKLTEERINAHIYKLNKIDFPELLEDLFITGGHPLLVDDLDEETKKKLLDMDDTPIITEGKYRVFAMIHPKAELWNDEKEHEIFDIVLENEDPKKNIGIWVNGILTESMDEEFFLNNSGMINISNDIHNPDKKQM